MKLLVNQLSKVANATAINNGDAPFSALVGAATASLRSIQNFTYFWKDFLPGLLAEQLAWLSRPIMP